MKVVLIALLIISLSFNCNAFVVDEQTIEVTSSANALIQPNALAVSILIKEQGRIVSKTRAFVEHKAAQVVLTAKSFGVKNDAINELAIKTSQVPQETPDVLGVDLQQKFSNGDLGRVYLDVGSVVSNQNSQPFQLTQEINITFPNSQAYEDFLNHAIKMGLESISSDVISENDIEMIYQQALREAVNKAKGKANIIATQMGRELGEIFYLKEHQKQNTANETINYPLCIAVTSCLKQQDLTVSARVTVKFSLK